MAKLWIGKKLYSVENEVQDYCDKQTKRIEKIEKTMQDICDYINNTGEVSKWKILNWLVQALKR